MSWTNRGCRLTFAPNIFVAIAISDGVEVSYCPPNKPAATRAKPGSRRKVSVLARRALRGEELWSDKDLSIANMPD